MTDEKYVFEQTLRERKRTARGAYAKKGGSRSKRCSLPSDSLTAKKRKELNGKVETINLNKPITWGEWKRLSLSLKQQYIEALYVKHHARLGDIARMFGRGENNLSRDLADYGIDNKSLASKSKAYRRHKPSAEWESFLTNSASDSEPTAPDVSLPSEDTNVAPEPSPAVKLYGPEPSGGETDEELLKVISGTLNYEGDPSAIFEKVMLAIDPSKKYKIQVRFQVYDY